MKSRLSKTVSIVLTTMLILSIAMAFTPAVFAPPPSQSPVMYFKGPAEYDPDLDGIYNFTTADMSIGSKFNATVWLDDVKELFSWQVKCWYNKTVLNATYMYYHPDEPIHPVGITVDPSFGTDNGRGYVMRGVTGVGTYSFTGSCPLVKIEFEVKMLPPKLGNVYSLLHINDTKTYLLWTDGETEIPVTKNDGDYYLYWALPAKPTIQCESYESLLGEKVLGETVPIDVNILGLEEAWMVTNFTFDLTYNSSFLDVIDVDATKNETGELFDGIAITASVNINDPNGFVNVTIKLVPPFVDYPDGTGALATITFNITAQNAAPDPALTCTLDLVESPTVELTDENNVVIPLEAVLDGTFTVNPYYIAPPPFFKASDEELGPCYAVGQTIDVEIRLCNVSWVWHLIGIQFRLTYNTTLLEPVECGATEGPWLDTFVNYTAGELGTWFIHYCEIDTMYPPHVLVGNMKLPDKHGNWHPPWPESDETGGLVCTIKFRALYQLYGSDLTGNLGFFGTLLVDPEAKEIDTLTPINGTYTIKGTDLPGRMIDLYTQYPPPYGGQGENQPSDMFWPQKEVVLCANVTYNCWPVEDKWVTFTVFDNSMNVWTQLEDKTDVNGVACVSFRMPSARENLFGVWKVKADVDLAEETLVDWTEFHFNYLINIVEISTDKWQYAHGEDVEITVKFTSHAQQNYTTAIRVTVHDDLNVPIGEAVVFLTIGGADYCTAKEYIKAFTIHVPHYAFVGYATIHAVPRVKLDTWVAAGPEFDETFYIMPV